MNRFFYLLLLIISYHRSTNEVRDVHRKQLEDAEIRLSNSKHNESVLNNELVNAKLQLTALKSDFDNVGFTSNS